MSYDDITAGLRKFLVRLGILEELTVADLVSRFDKTKDRLNRLHQDLWDEAVQDEMEAEVLHARAEAKRVEATRATNVADKIAELIA